MLKKRGGSRRAGVKRSRTNSRISLFYTRLRDPVPGALCNGLGKIHLAQVTSRQIRLSNKIGGAFALRPLRALARCAVEQQLLQALHMDNKLTVTLIPLL